MAAPAALAHLLMLLLPTLVALLLASNAYELAAPGVAWVGLGNFKEMAADRGFRTSAGNTLLHVGIGVPLSILGGLGLTLLVEAGARGRTFFRAVFFLPVVSLTVGMAAAWQYLLHPTIGPLNAALRSVGLGAPFWLSSSDTVLLSLAAIGVWESVGFNMVLFMAGLAAVPRELYAAAAVDGASGAFDRFRLVTWPLLGPTTLFVVILSMIRSPRVLDTVAVLTQGGPNKASEVLLYTMYTEGFTFLQLGYSAAITMVFLAAVLLLMWVQTRVLDRRVHCG
jgi:multiple sugar transport system permease protein